MLEIKNLTVRVGDFLLDQASLAVPPGTCHALLGPTGGGKTTLLETIMGFLTQTGGSIHLGEREIGSVPTERRGLSYLPQDVAVFPHLTVRENIHFGPSLIAGVNPASHDLEEELIEALAIGHLLDRTPDFLSGGELQRVALARAMAPGARALVLDEPFSSLHEGMKRELWFLVKELLRRYNLSILMVTHDLQEAFFLGDQVSILIAGRIHQTGSREEVYRFPATREAAAFFGIRNLFPIFEPTALSGDLVGVRCPELNLDLVLPPREKAILSAPAGGLVVGIRPEDISILTPEVNPRPMENILPGEILSLYPRVSSHTVLFAPQGSKRTLELEMPDHCFRKHSFREKDRLALFFKPENLFVIRT